jgi:hypothetical protein
VKSHLDVIAYGESAACGDEQSFVTDIASNTKAIFTKLHEHECVNTFGATAIATAIGRAAIGHGRATTADPAEEFKPLCVLCLLRRGMFGGLYVDTRSAFGRLRGRRADRLTRDGEIHQTNVGDDRGNAIDVHENERSAMSNVW